MSSYAPHMIYRSDYPNQVHQMTVSVSRHITVKKSGEFKYQKKPLDVSLKTFRRSDKNHIVHYLVRDHYSGVFYAEIHPCATLAPVEQLLFRAWSQKPTYDFCGVPDALAVPQTVISEFPSLQKLLTDYGIERIPVTSGFQSGAVRDIQTWEDLVRQYTALAEITAPNLE